MKRNVTKRSDDGVALVVVLLLTVALSAIGASLFSVHCSSDFM